MSTTPFPQPQARELTVEEQQALTQRCVDLEAVIKAGLVKTRELMWKVAEGLHEFDEEQGWLRLGYETLTDWLAQPDVTMSRATYYRLVQTWRELHVIRKVDVSTLRRLDPSKVHIVMPALKAATVPLTDALDDIEALGAQDLREKYVPKPALAPGPDDDDLSTPHVGAQTDEEPLSAAETPVDGTEAGDDQEAAPEAAGGTEAAIAPSAVVSAEVLLQANRDWLKLEQELLTASDSGQAHPRIDVTLIRVGLRGEQIARRGDRGGLNGGLELELPPGQWVKVMPWMEARLEGDWEEDALVQLTFREV
jgi:hypothetical protein